nr:chemotaxis protein CheB [uncultured Desulfobacter sp.]
MTHHESGIDMIVVGTSQGGFDALHSLLTPLPEDFNIPILVVRHQRPDAGDYILKALGRATKLKIHFAVHWALPAPGQVLLAPPDRHLLVGEDGRMILSDDEPVNFSRPAIDPLFESAAKKYGPRLIAVVLTGANHDGAKGVKAVKANGGIVIVQDPDSADARQMPEAALAAVSVDQIIWLDQIGPFLWSMVKDKNTKRTQKRKEL